MDHQHPIGNPEKPAGRQVGNNRYWDHIHSSIQTLRLVAAISEAGHKNQQQAEHETQHPASRAKPAPTKQNTSRHLLLTQRQHI
jgi:hypothetical protein